jgi:hypothetical protein
VLDVEVRADTRTGAPETLSQEAACTLSKENKGPCEAFVRLVELGIALKIAPLPQHPACWEHQVDQRWWICLNGHKESKRNSDGFDVPSFECVVKYNGWPAGMFGPGGGIIAAGEGANESTFIEALVAAKQRAEAAAS